jgi:hypothetical protein
MLKNLFPKGCLAATGRWDTGSGGAHGYRPHSAAAAGRAESVCHVCRKPVEVERYTSVKEPKAGPGILREKTGEAAPFEDRFRPRPAAPKVIKKVMNKSQDGRPAERYVLSELIEDTLRDMEKHGGREGLRMIKNYIPTFESVGVFDG